MPYYNPDVVQLSSSSTSSSEGAYDYEALKPQPKNNWTIEQRTTLDLLTTFYQHDWEVFAMVFNSLYQSQLPLLKGLTIQKLRTQHSFMKWYKPAFDRKAAQMKLQSMNPSSSLKFSDSEMRVSLEAKARSFGSVLKRKSLDGKLSSDRQAVIHRILKRKRTLVETDDGRTDFASSSESDGEASRRPKHKKRYKNFLVETPSRKVSSRRDSGLFTPPESTKLQRKLDSTVDKRLAPLGFRAFVSLPLTVIRSRNTCFGGVRLR